MKTLRWLHRWVGLLLGIFLAIVGISGSWLVYERELASPSFTLQSSKQHLPLEVLYRKAAAQLPPAADITIRFPQSGELPYQFWAGEQRVVIDQYSGQILAVRQAEFWPDGWIFHLHTELLLGAAGETFTGWLAIGMLVLAIVGIALWWPQQWSKAFRLRLDKSRFLFHLDLHQQLGIVVTPVLLLAAVTGISLSWSPSVTRTINAALGQSPSMTVENAPSRSIGRITTLDEAAMAANKALPGGRVGIMIVPAARSKPVIVRKQMPGDPHPNGLNFIHIGRGDAAQLRLISVAQADPSKRWFNWAYPLHTGQALPLHSWILFVCGLLPAFLLVTGIYMYLIRKRVISNN